VLEPDNPADLAAFAQTWLTLGEFDEAEHLLQRGLAESGNNHKILTTYWMTLLVTGRLEEAEQLLREMISDAGEDPPDGMRRSFQLQLAMLALAREDWSTAEEHLFASLDEYDAPGYDMDGILTLTLASYTAQRLGKKDLAKSRMELAERRLQRARLNGVDDADIFYAEASLKALQGEHQAAVTKLQEAYERGFRESWMLALDWRLEPLRKQMEFIELKTRIEHDLERSISEIRSTQVATL
jgi:tetratricopeptide (TPR) repeat protein